MFINQKLVCIKNAALLHPTVAYQNDLSLSLLESQHINTNQKEEADDETQKINKKDILKVADL